MPYKSLTINDQDYPKLLREVPGAPDQIYIRGDQSLLSNPAVAIVGTRKASKKGRQIARGLAKEIAEAGYVIVSGLALGIDAAAHTGAIDSGKTVAVLGTNIANIYPKENKELADKILEKGAIVSEYSENQPTTREDFLRRNRIISGLSSAVVVVEAPEISGALSTARYAGEQGRDVFVVPGEVDDPNYTGSHNLIRDGAILVKSAKDVLEDINNII